MLYEELLKEEYIKNIYLSIENNSRIPISHGIIHILNVVNYCKRLADLFALDDNEREILFASAVMHDIAQVFLQKNHAQNSAFMSKEILENNETIDPNYIKSKIDIDRLCKIVANHGGKKEEEYDDKLASILILADKLDVTKDRIRPAYKKYNFLWFMEKIEKVELFLENNELKVIFNTNEKITLEQLNDKKGLEKTIKKIELFAKRFNLNYKIFTKDINS